MEQTDLNGSLKRPHDESRDPAAPDGGLPRPKRPKSSKACNACRKQKSRCERLAGDSDACHRCSVIGIACVFDADSPPENVKSRKPRQLLPRSDPLTASPLERLTPLTSSRSPDTTRLHALADTTELMSRPAVPATNTNGRDSSAHQSTTPTSKTKSTLSPETLSTVESTLFPSPREPTSEAESARFRADWRRWAAPLTLLKTLVRRNRPSPRPMSTASQQLVRPAENGTISIVQERRLKEHFRLQYLPWLPAVRFARGSTPNCLDDVSPFLTTVICATAARTLAEISPNAMENLRSLALLHVGQVFSNPAAHRLVDSLYALLVLVLWPLDAADDVVLLINGGKQLASAYERSRPEFHLGPSEKPGELDTDHARLWYTICASETIMNLGTGLPASPPPLEDLIERLGSASDLALRSGCTSDILVVLQTSLHRIVAAAMGEKGPQDLLKGGSPALGGRESLLHYISAVHMVLTRLGEWDIEFHSISAECEEQDAVFYAVLEIEYHYLHLMLATHCILTLCHAYPLVSAPDEVKYALWSWGITGNKSAHAAVRLFNVFARQSDGPLASAPDRMFAMMVVAVMLILRHQVAAYEYGRRRGVAEPPPAGFTKQGENAIRKAADRLGAIGRSGSAEHAAARYVEIIEALLRIWDGKRAQEAGQVTGHACELSKEPHTHLPVPEPLFSEQQQQHVGSMQDMDLNLFGGDVFSDSVFPWDGIGSFDWGNAAQ